MSQPAEEHARFAGFHSPVAQSETPESEGGAGRGAGSVQLVDPSRAPGSPAEGVPARPDTTWFDPAGELAAIAARVAAFDAAARDYVSAARPGNTRRAYDGDWALWSRFCGEVAVPATTVSPGLLAGFALWLERGQHHDPPRPAAPATIRRRVYGAVSALREHGVEVAAGASAAADETVNAYQRRLAHDGARRGRGPAPAVAVSQLRAICAELPPTLAGHRDRAMLLLGFALAARRNELAHLGLADIAEDPTGRGLLVTVRAAKTGPRTVAVPLGARAATCPVTAWRTWTRAAGLHQPTDNRDDADGAAAAEKAGGRAFRAIDRHGNLAASITGSAIGSIVTRAADAAGLMVRFTAHSLRAGLATEARRAGHDHLTIARQGGWADGSTVLSGYMRIVDRWSDNALEGIGL